MAEEKQYSELENKVMAAMEDVIDPELGIDMLNLGLIYDVDVDDAGKCILTMTLTTMGCPLGDLLNDQITQAVVAIDGITECDIELVWEPAWSMDRMSRFAKVALGIHG
ncbi:metal-sulfur cluster assembly factor [Secundilactobacillus collinoides]|uniref:MIP18 family-like domain-containing protein n=2 Tax=Secundilactobacillus collinoides TaxID=33960 RepID=A0A0R2B4Y1_SECCO|nr:metal-sulfur cluster assembly factor [Secundilactobacillus collinoides]KRM73746.1 hypothetical protein FC82_GL001183 [Secundilactobacillus collinoides DSM 20515 = JCM 1123]KZL36000.1 DNA methyltransferase [Secundilactobacillus collinoides]